MKKYQLKKGQESIEVVDGKFAGRRYQKGKSYKKIPPEEAHRFEEIKPPKTKEKQEPIKGASDPKRFFSDEDDAGEYPVIKR